VTKEDRVVAVAASAHLLTHAYMMIFPTVLVLIAADTVLGIEEYFKLGAIGTLCYGLFGAGAIPAGILADKFGSKRMLAICMLASGVSSLLVGISFSVYILIAGMACLGLAASIYHPAGLSFVSRNVTRKGRAMGFHGVGGNIGLTAGYLLSGAVASLWGWRSAFLFFGVLGVALGFFISKMPVEDQVEVKKAEKKTQDRVMPSAVLVLFIVYGTSVLYGLCYRGFMMYLPKHFVHNVYFALNDVAKAGLLVSIVSLSGTVGQFFGGSLCDRMKRPEFAYLFVFLFTTPLFFGIWLLKDWSLFRMSVMFAPFFFAWQPLQNTLIAKYAAQAAHGLSYGVNFMLLMGVGSLAASVGGFVTDKLDVSYVFVVLGLISSLSLVLVFYVLMVLHGPQKARVDA
jgi:FSR family fosmidomycin resistance protein-like MFS transporter